jgi:NAD(P)H-dependent flavin oxidoreductase YrpB (nitropropane dioxygenase family)
MSHAPLPELIVACRTPQVAQAHAIVARLAEAGVEARVVGGFLSGGYGGVAAGGISDVEVWISAADRATAAPIVAEMLRVPVTAALAAPSDDADAPQYSLLTLLLVISVAAVFAAAGAVRHEDVKAYSETMYLVLTLVVVTLICRRWQRIYLPGPRRFDEEA